MHGAVLQNEEVFEVSVVHNIFGVIFSIWYDMLYNYVFCFPSPFDRIGKWDQSQLAEKARIRMAKHCEKVKADPALAEDYRKRDQEASSVHRQRRHTILAANQHIRRILKSHEGKCSSHRKELEERAAGPHNYEEEVALYCEIRADEKWQQSRWGMVALERAMETED
ncbi:hypothetical protein C8J57DRAFT_1534376 [Mycena rebaudengoi]|nr:hypothetical protein C8J57DRAFT_1534376 [Mycena rebaudengoi]